MKIFLDQRLLETTGHNLDLLTLFRLGQERHRLLLEPDYDPADPSQPIQRWLGLWPPELQEDLRDILQQNQRREAQNIRLRGEIWIRSDAASSRFVASSDEGDAGGFQVDLPLCEALILLEERLHLLVENARNDGAFLRALCPHTHLAWLNDAEAAGWLEFANGGGNSEIGMLPATLAAEPGTSAAPLKQARACGRFVALIDSDEDKDKPNQPSRASDAILRAWRSRGMVAHRLRRRAAENYLPRAALELWVNTSSAGEATQGGAREARQRKLDAFFAQPPEARHHTRMRAHFDKNIRDLFAQHRHALTWHEDEAVHAEFLTLFERIREHT